MKYINLTDKGRRLELNGEFLKCFKIFFKKKISEIIQGFVITSNQVNTETLCDLAKFYYYKRDVYRKEANENIEFQII